MNDSDFTEKCRRRDNVDGVKRHCRLCVCCVTLGIDAHFLITLLNAYFKRKKSQRLCTLDEKPFFPIQKYNNDETITITSRSCFLLVLYSVHAHFIKAHIHISVQFRLSIARITRTFHKEKRDEMSVWFRHCVE